MKLNQLPKITERKRKRLGRGLGSGKGGHNVGRGTSGQKARGKIPLTFEGTKNKKSFLKKLPLLRGKGKFKPSKKKSVVINTKYLNFFEKGETVNLETLIKKGIIDKKIDRDLQVKILGEGELKVALTVELLCSGGAAKKIKKAGGKVILPK